MTTRVEGRKRGLHHTHFLHTRQRAAAFSRQLLTSLRHTPDHERVPVSELHVGSIAHACAGCTRACAGVAERTGVKSGAHDVRSVSLRRNAAAGLKSIAAPYALSPLPLFCRL